MKKNDAYKNTLNMPKTAFSMRADLVNKEKFYRQKWDKMQLYQEVLKSNQNHPRFILHDGPPYANGNLHVGHALNKILKDFVVRLKNMQGFYAPFKAGWDTHGLPIEHKMLSEMNVKFTDISPIELRKRAAKFAWSQIKEQKKQFKTFQLLSDLEDIYITMDKTYEMRQLKLFKKMFFEGLVYKGLKPVYWSPSSQSALAEAEVEYHEKRDPSIYVAFEILDGNDKVTKGENLVIWTTTPWTLIANSGVAINHEFIYAKLEHEGEIYIVAKDLIEHFTKEVAWETYQVVSLLKAEDFIGLKYFTPIFHKAGKVVYGHHVTLESGSGLVHMAPLFGEDDFIIAQKENLEMMMHINDDGTINAEGKQFAGLFYEDANKEIAQFLEKNQKLIKLKFLKHSYPHDWRTKKPIMFRGTPQWFISIEGLKVRIQKALAAVDGAPSWVIKRLGEMIQKRGPWTISRQRVWGVPIPIFYDQNEKILQDPQQFDHIIDLVSQYGTDIWFEKSTEELLLEKYRNQGFTKETSIMDVWFDSGSSSIAVDVEGKAGPFEMYLEGTDQFRGWFNSSLINSVIFRNESPYKFLLSHGFVLDGKNEKMSKSKGNVFDPAIITKKIGADILRLWVANVEYNSDVKISNEIIKQISENYRKIRNTIRFLLANLQGFSYQKDLPLKGIHLYAKEKIENLRYEILEAYRSYKFYNVTKNVTATLIDFSNFYLNFGKDILYVENLDNPQRIMMLNNMHYLLETVLIALAPILPTTIEEAYEHFEKENKKASVHLEKMWTEATYSNKEKELWKVFFNFKNDVYREVEKLIANKVIHRVNEAKITYNQELPEWLTNENLQQLLMVANLEKGDNFQVSVYNGKKCPRCWNFFDTKRESELCLRCESVLKTQK